jgi:integrase/recombinase XerD
MLEVLYATGLRATEVVSLQLSDIDLERGILTCRQGKSQRQIHLPPRCAS